MIRNGGVSINNCKIQDEEYILRADDLIGEKFMLVAAGKKNKFVLRIK